MYKFGILLVCTFLLVGCVKRGPELASWEKDKNDWSASISHIESTPKTEIQRHSDFQTNWGGSSYKKEKALTNNQYKTKLKKFDELEKLLEHSKKITPNERKWLFVIGIEHYEYTDSIIYSNRTAKMFVRVVQKNLGVPKQNSFVLLDAKATQADIKNNFKSFLRHVKNNDIIYFYYNGHGVPIPQLHNEPFMLASNSKADYISDEKFFSLQNIYFELSHSKAKKVFAFIDSCFSGITDNKAIFKGVGATKMVAKPIKFDTKKMVVFMAGNKYQFSNAYNKKGYRLFSYYLMKNIINGERDVQTLYQKTKKQTYETSYEEYGDVRVQSPTIEGNLRLSL